MAKNTEISWCDSTFNPWEGCAKVSPGCAHCYAEARNKRFGGGAAPNWGKGAPRRRTSADNWKHPLRWNREAGEREALSAQFPHHSKHRRPRVFCASLADWLDDEVPVEWLADLLALIKDTPSLDWLLLTKRPQLWRERMVAVMSLPIPEGPEAHDRCSASAMAALWLNGGAPANVWIGTSVEDQARADERIPHLLAIPARVHFLSMEPLLGSVDLNSAIGGTRWIGGQRGCCGTHFHHGRAGEVIHGVLHDGDPTVSHHHHDERCGKGIDWVICGGESGPGARPIHPDWARSLRDQCQAAGVAFFWKQWGEWLPWSQWTNELQAKHDGRAFHNSYPTKVWNGQFWEEAADEEANENEPWDIASRVGKSSAGRLLDGREWNEMPARPL